MLGEGHFLLRWNVLDITLLDGQYWAESVGHHVVDAKCWADVETWKVLGSSYTLVDFSLVMESVGH